MEYIVVRTNGSARLRVEVEKRINLGWVPQGGVSISHSSLTGDDYYQAMIRETTKLED